VNRAPPAPRTDRCAIAGHARRLRQTGRGRAPRRAQRPASAGAVRQVVGHKGVAVLQPDRGEELVAKAPDRAIGVVEGDSAVDEGHAVERRRQAAIRIHRRGAHLRVGAVVDVNLLVRADEGSRRCRAFFAVVLRAAGMPGDEGIAGGLDEPVIAGRARRHANRSTDHRLLNVVVAARPLVVEMEHAVLLDGAHGKSAPQIQIPGAGLTRPRRSPRDPPSPTLPGLSSAPSAKVTARTRKALR
jgi:hypothetical protein